MDISLIVVESETSIVNALTEIQELLRAVSSASTPHRLSAVRYTHCRAALLDGALRPSMPGFLIQCVSIYKFHDFINLYHPKAEARIAFIDQAFSNCRSVLESKRSYDVFTDPDF